MAIPVWHIPYAIGPAFAWVIQAARMVRAVILKFIAVNQVDGMGESKATAGPFYSFMVPYLDPPGHSSKVTAPSSVA